MTITQIQPFNPYRFDACMAHMAASHDRRLTQYDMVKLHVMTDVYHVLLEAKPVIGGTFAPWTFGPVSSVAYHRVRRWEKSFVRSGEEPPYFRLGEVDGNILKFTPTVTIDADDFSASESAAMNNAWRQVMSMGWKESQEFFHNPKFYMGYAWNKALNDGPRNLDWNDILDAYAAENSEDLTAVKSMIQF